jgi:hypothetical protein
MLSSDGSFFHNYLGHKLPAKILHSRITVEALYDTAVHYLNTRPACSSLSHLKLAHAHVSKHSRRTEPVEPGKVEPVGCMRTISPC